MDLASGVRSGDRVALARAITLVESQRSEDQEAAQELLRGLMSDTGASHRIGVSGAPGVGKSTFIDAFGMHLLSQGHRVAVLAVDPSSTRSGGSILGDKSRMSDLAQEDGAFIRPSPSANTLGGVARRTRESMLLCEAAGFDRVLIETVGVGQSETEVSSMVDTFLLLLLPGAGDELQGIKKGIVELADVLAVNKADGDNVARAGRAQTEYAAALRYIRPKSTHWQPKAVTLSAIEGTGLAKFGELLEAHRQALVSSDTLEQRRLADAAEWIRQLADELLLDSLHRNERFSALLEQQSGALLAGEQGARDAARDILQSLRTSLGSQDD